MFYEWTPSSDSKPTDMKWETNCEYLVSKLCALEALSNIRGWGCVKLLNAKLTKPSETAILAVPPATANLKTSRDGDRVLHMTMHLAIVSEVRLPHAQLNA